MKSYYPLYGLCLTGTHYHFAFSNRENSSKPVLLDLVVYLPYKPYTLRSKMNYEEGLKVLEMMRRRD